MSRSFSVDSELEKTFFYSISYQAGQTLPFMGLSEAACVIKYLLTKPDLFYMNFMSTFSELNDAKKTLQESSTVVRILDKLAGEQANFKVDFQELKFHLRNKLYTLNGEVNFNVVHSPENHASSEQR